MSKRKGAQNNRAPSSALTLAPSSHHSDLISSSSAKPRPRPLAKGPAPSTNDTHVKTTRLTHQTMSLWPIITTLFTFRSLSAIFSPFNDCDEVFNYMEPLHVLLRGTGLQTWEYQPEFALRSYTFLILHAPFALLSWLSGVDSTYGKLGTFMLTRLLLGVFSCFCQAKLIRSVGLFFGEKSARLFLFLLLFAPGLTHSGHAFLPQGFCMNILMLVFSHWLDATTTTTISPLYHKLATSDIYNRHQRFLAQNPAIAATKSPTTAQIQSLIGQTGTPITNPPAPTWLHLLIAVIPFWPLPSTLPQVEDLTSGPAGNSISSNTGSSNNSSSNTTQTDKTDHETNRAETAATTSTSSHLFDLQLYQGELQAVRHWASMIFLITVCGLVGWPFTLIFLLPIIFSFLDTYMNISLHVTSRWCQVREAIYWLIFTYIIPIPFLQRLLINGHPNHPQWLLDTFFYQTKAIFFSHSSHMSTCAPLASSSPLIPITTGANANSSNPASAWAPHTDSPNNSRTSLTPLLSTSTTPSSPPISPPSPAPPTPRAKRLKVFFFLCCFTAFVGLLVTGVGLLVDGYFYNRWTLSFLNIALYNSNFSGGEDDLSRGQQLYGTEPPSYYLVNLILNFNVAVIFAIVFVLVAVLMNLLIVLCGKYRLTMMLLKLFPVRTDLHAGAYLLAPPIPTLSSITRSDSHEALTDSDEDHDNTTAIPTGTTANTPSGTHSTANSSKRSPSVDLLEDLVAPVAAHNAMTAAVSGLPEHGSTAAAAAAAATPTTALSTSSPSTFHTPASTPQRSYYIKHPPLFYRMYATLSRIHHQFVVILPALIWTIAMVAQPHKEERFLYIIYPALCLAAVFGLEFCLDVVGYFFNLVSHVFFKGNTGVLVNHLKESSAHGLQCECCLADYPRNFLEPVAQHEHRAHSAPVPTPSRQATHHNHASSHHRNQNPSSTPTHPIAPSTASSTTTGSGSSSSSATTARPETASSRFHTGIVSTIRTCIHYLFHIPTSSLISLRYVSHAHPVRKPYRPYNGILYFCVFTITVIYMSLSVSRNLAVIFGYSAPSLTMFKLYANVRSDVPTTPLFTTDDAGEVTRSQVFRANTPGRLATTALFHHRSLDDQVEMLFDSGANRYSQLIELYQVPDNLVLLPPSPGSTFRPVSTDDTDGTPGSNTAGDDDATAQQGQRLGGKSVGSRSKRITSAQIESFHSREPKSQRFVHPCFARHLQEYYHVQGSILQSQLKRAALVHADTANASGKWPGQSPIPTAADPNALSADEFTSILADPSPHTAINDAFDRFVSGEFPHGATLAYFPSRMAECLAQYQPSTQPTPAPARSSQLQPDSPFTPLTNRIPLNVNNHLGSQPLNHQLYSLVKATGGQFVAKSAQPDYWTRPLRSQQLDPVHSPPLPAVDSALIAGGIGSGPHWVDPKPVHRNINSETNPYDEMNRDLMPVLPLSFPPRSVSEQYGNDAGNQKAGTPGAKKASSSTTKRRKRMDNAEVKKLVEEATTIKLCIGSEWFRFPSSFFLPDAAWVKLDALKDIIESLPDDFIQTSSASIGNSGTSNSTSKDPIGNETAHGPSAYDQALLDFMVRHDKHIPGTGVGTVVGDEILLRPRVELEYLPRFHFNGMLPQHFASDVVTSPRAVPVEYQWEEGHGDVRGRKISPTNPTSPRKPLPFFNAQTSHPAPNFNDLNRSDQTRLLPQLDWCDYIVDTDISVRKTADGSSYWGQSQAVRNSSPAPTDFDIIKEQLYRRSFQVVSSVPMIDPERSPSISRAFYLLHTWNTKNRFVPFNLWAKKPHVAPAPASSSPASSQNTATPTAAAQTQRP